MINTYAALFNVPANTPLESIEQEFTEVFPGLDIPEGGIMPTSVTSSGRHIVMCLLAYDLDTTETMVSDAGKNWQVWGFRTIDSVVPVYSEEPDEGEGEINETIVGHKPEYTVAVNTSILSFLGKRYYRDSEGNITGEQTKSIRWIPTYAGMDPWL